MPRLNIHVLQDPAVAHEEALEGHHEEEERKDPQPKSLCNQCRYAFRVAQSQEHKWDEEPALSIWCTGPWFDGAREMFAVTSCNAFTPGTFDPREFHEEKEGDDLFRGEGATGIEGDPAKVSGEEEDTTKAADASLDAELSALEKEPVDPPKGEKADKEDE